MDKETLKYILDYNTTRPPPEAAPRKSSTKFFPCPLPSSWAIADRSVRKQSVNPKKLHGIDWALGYPFVPEQTIDAGCKLETAVFLHWRRRREDLGYLAGEYEVDLAINNEQPELLINVALSVSQPATWEREIRTLQWAGEKLPKARRVLIVHEGSTQEPPAGIEVVEAWRYLLGD